jgi:hypothetical protein
MCSPAILDTISLEIFSMNPSRDATSSYNPHTPSLSTERPQISDSSVIYVTEEVILNPLSGGGRQPTPFGSGEIQPFVISALIEQSNVSANIP